MKIPLRLLLVEDSMDDALLLVRELELGGYDVSCERVETFTDMNAALDREGWDVIIADYTMPKFSGTAALELVRSRSIDAPFIFVSGTIGEDAAVAAMKIGADDYIMKGNLKRLTPAVQRELRDAQTRRDRRTAEERLQVPGVLRSAHRAAQSRAPAGSPAAGNRDLPPGRRTVVAPDAGSGSLQRSERHAGASHRRRPAAQGGAADVDGAARGGHRGALWWRRIRDHPALHQRGRRNHRGPKNPHRDRTAVRDRRARARCSASIGIALANGQAPTANDMLRQADVAMFLAKDAKSGYAIYTPEFDRHSPQRLALVSDLRQAIERRQLSLHYQPKVDLRTGRVIGTEALVRWQHPTHGLILPSRFIGLAEQIGFIKPLTLFVLEQALDQCRRWRQSGLDITVAVNLSAGSLQEAHLADQLADVIRGCEADPSWLEFEITESVVMSDPNRAMEILTRLHRMGLQFTIDDFGIGHSSLSYLKRLPVRGMKIDQSFVMEMARHDDVIVRSTIDLAHNLGLQIVAEGVESR